MPIAVVLLIEDDEQAKTLVEDMLRYPESRILTCAGERCCRARHGVGVNHYPALAADPMTSMRRAMADQYSEPRKDESIKYMPIHEFIDTGYLHEVNRLVLHPCGLALELRYRTDSGDPTEGMLHVWDYRDDPEGIVFGEGDLDPDKADRVAQSRRRHRDARVELFDGTYTRDEPVEVQPIPRRLTEAELEDRRLSQPKGWVDPHPGAR